MIRKFIAAFVLIFFMMSSTAFAETTINGVSEFNYEDELKAGDVIRTTGNGFFPTHWEQNKIFYKTFVRQVARMNALRNITETLESKLKRLDVRSNFTMENYKVVNDIVEIKIYQDSKTFELLEKNVRQVGEAKFLEGDICEVTMEIILPENWKDCFKK